MISGNFDSHNCHFLQFNDKQLSFVCLIVLTSDHQTFGSLIQVRRHAIQCINIVHSSRPLLRGPYEVILQHLSRIW